MSKIKKGDDIMFLEFKDLTNTNETGIAPSAICWGCEQICFLKCADTCAANCRSSCANFLKID